MSRLDGKELIGMVVDYDDPLNLGRIRVGIPSIMGQKINKDLLPWLPTSSVSNSDGGLTNDRPPQPGTIVSAFFPYGSGSVNGIVKTIINGLRNPEALTGVDLSKKLSWVEEALNFKPDINGPPDVAMVTESNPTGAEKVTAKINEGREVLSFAERVGIPSTLVTKALIPAYDAISSVATGVDNAASAFSAELASQLPGELMNMASQLTKVDVSGLSNELQAAVGNLSKIMSTSMPTSGTNFVALGLRGNLAADVFSTAVKSFDDLERALENGITEAQSAVFGSSGTAQINVGVEGISMSVSQDGSITVSFSEAINNLLASFSQLMDSIPVATGTMLGNSQIASTLTRLPQEAQAKVRSALEAVPSSLSLSLGKSNAFLGST